MSKCLCVCMSSFPLGANFSFHKEKARPVEEQGEVVR